MDCGFRIADFGLQTADLRDVKTILDFRFRISDLRNSILF
ncbi:hypothetical protein D1AOALGA4SA_5083 [Olavius algarvensis Delta 1 endosymbiont]|nr:hypothetical protein D1AOALGA4SA_5083 [Olavius algarvensis Delta 1 endosymbiont]